MQGDVKYANTCPVKARGMRERPRPWGVGAGVVDLSIYLDKSRVRLGDLLLCHLEQHVASFVPSLLTLHE